MRPRGAAWAAAAGSVAAFILAFYLRLNGAYGPFNLSGHPGDWMVLWELWRHDQIAPRIVVQAAGLGAVAAVVPWVILGWWRRCRRTP